ncbi:MAG: methyltransferase, TIGR04325 family [Actinomycetota bacterium]|nr:methyltransferase, TIGR04325 family [Actinomycetota bacterium]
MRETLRRTLRNWGPPKVRNWLVRQLVGVRFAKHWPDSIGGGWRDAAEEARKGYADATHRLSGGLALGFDPQDDLLTEFSAADKQMQDCLVQFALVVARAALGCDNLRLLDFGGGFGTHSLVLSRLLPGLEIEYTVCELPGFCEIGQALNSQLRFVQGLAQAGTGYQLVYASSSVQYERDWRKLVADLCLASVRSLFVTRTPFVYDYPAYVTIQRAYKTAYPGWVFNYHEFVTEVARNAFSLKEVFINGPGIPVRGVMRPNVHLGLLFERHDARNPC